MDYSEFSNDVKPIIKVEDEECKFNSYEQLQLKNEIGIAENDPINLEPLEFVNVKCEEDYSVRRECYVKVTRL